jgi:hypothetical protein
MRDWYKKMAWFVFIILAVAVFVSLPSPTGFLVAPARSATNQTGSIQTADCENETLLMAGHPSQLLIPNYEAQNQRPRFVSGGNFDNSTGVITVIADEGYQTALLILEDSQGRLRSCLLRIKLTSG